VLATPSTALIPVPLGLRPRDVTGIEATARLRGG